MERSGRTLKSLVQKSDPFDDGICSDKERCMVCRNGSRKGGRCRQECIEYEIRCEKCGDVYEGESSRNAYTRGCEHQAAYEKREKDSIMWRHASTQHNDEDPPKFSMKVTHKHDNALSRQISEAVTISNTPGAKLINNKQEFGHNFLWRVSLTSD